MALNDKIHDPLFGELFRIALPQMEGYQSDLGHDVLRLAVAVPGERYLWGVRKYGTEMRAMPHDPESRAWVMRDTPKVHPDHRWYLLEIAAVRQDGYCSGTVTPLPPAQAAAPRDPMHYDLRDAATDEKVRIEQQAARLQQLIDEDPFKEPL